MLYIFQDKYSQSHTYNYFLVTGLTVADPVIFSGGGHKLELTARASPPPPRKKNTQKNPKNLGQQEGGKARPPPKSVSAWFKVTRHLQVEQPFLTMFYNADLTFKYKSLDPFVLRLSDACLSSLVS